MAKVKIHSQKAKYAGLNGRLSKYVGMVRGIIDGINQDAANLVSMTGYDGSKPFSFADYPITKDRVDKMQQKFLSQMTSLIYSGTSNEWKNSNLAQDAIADKALKVYGLKRGNAKTKVYYQTNSDQLKAFQERQINGMNLSQNVWNLSNGYKEELEAAISTAIEKGTSAVTLSKKISKYLADYKSLQKDYKERYGKATEAHDCEYRSIRLARSEINMAYRTAEQKRWQQMDFVIGYEIKLSGSHPHKDICDMLAGKYPKDFVWTGWHPNDLCYCVPILKTEEEFFETEHTPDINNVEERTKIDDNANKEQANRAMNDIAELEAMYGTKIPSLKIGKKGKETNFGSCGEHGIILKTDGNLPGVLKYRDGTTLPQNIGGGESPDMQIHCITYHEYAHWLTQVHIPINENLYFPRTYKEYKKTQVGRGLSEADKKRNYESYLKQCKKHKERIDSLVTEEELNKYLEFRKAQKSLFEEYIEDCKKRGHIAKVSVYGYDAHGITGNIMGEFFSESFAKVKALKQTDNIWANKAVKLIDDYWKPEQISRGKIDIPIVSDVPENFKKWVNENVVRARSWSTEPYFIRDNKKYVSNDFVVNVYSELEKKFVRKGRTQFAMESTRLEYYKETHPDIREVQQAAVNAYTQGVRKGNKGATSREINRRLRNENPDEYVSVATELMNKCLNKLESVQGIVYRGETMSKKKFFERIESKLGTEITEKGFLSTSLEEGTPIKFISHDGVPKSHVRVLYEIESKNGKNISDISEFNGIFTEENQKEVLFRNGTKFLVKKIDLISSKTYKVYLIEQ